MNFYLKKHLDLYPYFRFCGIGFILYLAIFLFMDKIVMPLYVRLGDEIDVPNVIEKKDIDAITELEQFGFAVDTSDKKYDSHYAPGAVISQHPLPLTRVKKGRTIQLTICLGEQKITMPDLKGISLRDAEIKLTEKDLQKGDIYPRPSTLYPQGVVIDQSIAPGQIINKGTAVNLTVSSSREVIEVQVPNVINITLRTAREIITKNGLKVGTVSFVPNKEYLPNTVLFQFPSAGTMALFGDSVSLVISKIDTSKSF